ncbi:MAG: hypothetical protein AABW79_05145 [Nanoarchaeota archaeon]
MTTQEDKIKEKLEEAIKLIGPERDNWLERPIYDFLHRYGPMLCIDVVLIPLEDKPSVILGKRNNQGVAPGEWWIFGGRADKSVNYQKIAKEKVKKEIGIDINIVQEDFLGFATIVFKPNNKEDNLRNYNVSTPNLCFAKQIKIDEKSINASDGHSTWKKFHSIDESWPPYVIHAVASAWKRFYPKEWNKNLSPKVKKILSDNSIFIHLNYEKLVP